jgi:metal-dependent HD superfamily phosphatase/phosphodiesterase
MFVHLEIINDNFMKKILLLLGVTFTIISCSVADDNTKFHLELLPVKSADLPATFKKDSLYELSIQYVRPSTCHIFDGFYYDKNANKRTIAIQTTVVEQNNCTDAPVNPLTEILEFIPTTESSYIFRLWKGRNANGVDVYDEVEIPVVP